MDDVFHLDVHDVCYIILVQSFEPPGRRFTNVRYYYYYGGHEDLVSAVDDATARVGHGDTQTRQALSFLISGCL